MIVAKKVATVLKEVLACDGMNILQNNGETAGQTVFHLHVHLIPRYKNDDVTIHWIAGKESNILEDTLIEKIQTTMNE